MLVDSQEEQFVKTTKSPAMKMFGAVLAVALTAVVLVGYTYLRNKHARDAAAKLATETIATEP